MLETLALMGHGFVNAMSLSNLLFMAGGTAIGIIIGCLPGLSAAMGVALLLPMTFTMAPETGLIVLGAIYCGAIFGGSISAILIHTPGTPASAATAIEGYQMTLKGQAGKALATACWSSFWGGLLSCISLYFFAPALAKLALKFMSAEYFWLSLFGLTIIAGVSSKSILKGLMSGAFGLLLSTIGMDPIEGAQRFMFGQASLYEGINTTCALIGLFSMSQVLILAEKKIKQRAKAAKFSDKIALSGKEIKRITPTILRSWIIGNLIGILEGELDGSVMLSSHMDRVPNGYGIQPVEKDGVLYSDGTTILAADDISGVCAILEGVRRAKASGKPLSVLAGAMEVLPQVLVNVRVREEKKHAFASDPELREAIGRHFPLAEVLEPGESWLEREEVPEHLRQAFSLLRRNQELSYKLELLRIVEPELVERRSTAPCVVAERMERITDTPLQS